MRVPKGCRVSKKRPDKSTLFKANEQIGSRSKEIRRNGARNSERFILNLLTYYRFKDGVCLVK